MKSKDLPTILPLYTADDTVLLPRAQLPLLLRGSKNKALIDYASHGGDQLLAIVQSHPDGGYFDKGCVGRISHVKEGNPLFTVVEGICRFKVEEVLPLTHIPMVKVSYDGYENDLIDTTSRRLKNRPQLLEILKSYLDDQDIHANWEELDHASDDLILTSLTMACPFAPIEKQALLESSSLNERCDMIIALMEMASPFSVEPRPVLH